MYNSSVSDVYKRQLLDDLLRREWGFEGIVVSDYGGIGTIAHSHHCAEAVSYTHLDVYKRQVLVNSIRILTARQTGIMNAPTEVL